MKMSVSCQGNIKMKTENKSEFKIIIQVQLIV